MDRETDSFVRIIVGYVLLISDRRMIDLSIGAAEPAGHRSRPISRRETDGNEDGNAF